MLRSRLGARAETKERCIARSWQLLSREYSQSPKVSSMSPAGEPIRPVAPARSGRGPCHLAGRSLRDQSAARIGARLPCGRSMAARSRHPAFARCQGRLDRHGPRPSQSIGGSRPFAVPFPAEAAGSRESRQALEQGRADPHDRRTLENRRLEVAAHAHRKFGQHAGVGERGGQVVPQPAEAGEVAAGVGRRRVGPGGDRLPPRPAPVRAPLPRRLLTGRGRP